MNLYLLRHGIASDPGAGADSERPLTAEGKRELLRVGAGLQKLGTTFDLILSSPYVRARETAKLIAKAVQCANLQLTDCLAPAGRSSELILHLKKLKPGARNILLVGHEPYLSSLISLWLAGHFELDIRIKKAGICKLKIERLEHGKCARLDWLLTPKQLLLLG